MRVAIVGGGISAAAASATLRAAGVEVVLFDKARGPGGRMSAKRVGHQQIDFGAQYFTARDAAFLEQTKQWLADGSAVLWPLSPWLYDRHGLCPSPDQQARYVGLPGMHQVVRQLLADTEQHYNCRVAELSYSNSAVSSLQSGQWTLSTSEGASYAGFDAVILTCPPEQSRQLLAAQPDTAALAATIPAGLLLPCWAVLLELSTPVAHPAAAIFIRQGALSWAVRHQHKPGRSAVAPEQWLVHFTAQSSLDLLEEDASEVAAVALLELSLVFGQQLHAAESLCHRWLYASYNEQLAAPGLLQQGSLLLAGDWCYGGRVENAWLAGRDAALQLLRTV